MEIFPNNYSILYRCLLDRAFSSHKYILEQFSNCAGGPCLTWSWTPWYSSWIQGTRSIYQPTSGTLQYRLLGRWLLEVDFFEEKNATNWGKHKKKSPRLGSFANKFVKNKLCLGLSWSKLIFVSTKFVFCIRRALLPLLDLFCLVGVYRYTLVGLCQRI